MAKIGYARVSSTGQSLEVQLSKLIASGCKEADGQIFQEKKSGTNANNRPQLQECLRHVRKGDTLVITKLDRLARSTLDLAKIAEDLEKKLVRKAKKAGKDSGRVWYISRHFCVFQCFTPAYSGLVSYSSDSKSRAGTLKIRPLNLTKSPNRWRYSRYEEA